MMNITQTYVIIYKSMQKICTSKPSMQKYEKVCKHILVFKVNKSIQKYAKLWKEFAKVWKSMKRGAKVWKVGIYFYQ